MSSKNQRLSKLTSWRPKLVSTKIPSGIGKGCCSVTMATHGSNPDNLTMSTWHTYPCLFLSLPLSLSLSLSSSLLSSLDHLPSQSKKSTVGNMVDKMSPMKLMPWTKHQKEETLEEINRKMQRALEEALMKNISLQEVRATYMYTECVCVL